MAPDPTEFSISTAEHDSWLVVALHGELDLATAPELEELLLARLDDGVAVTLDLRSLEFMDSSGVRALVTAHARAGLKGTTLRIVRPAADSIVERIITISGIDGQLDFVDEPGAPEAR
jgi:anti-sigma B factor antagonist